MENFPAIPDLVPTLSFIRGLHSFQKVFSMAQQRQKDRSTRMDDHKIEEALARITSTLESLNFQPPEKTATSWAKFLQFTAIYMPIQSLMMMLFGWRQWNFSSRVAAMENLTYMFGFFSISTDLFLMSSRTSELIMLVRSRYHLFGIKMNNLGSGDIFMKKKMLINKMEKDCSNLLPLVEKIIKCVFFGYMTLPVVSITFYIAKQLEIEDLRLPFIFYIPHLYNLSLTFSSIHQYLICTLITTIFVSYSAVLTISVFKIMLLSVNNVLIEMEIFRLDFLELNCYFNHCLGEAEYHRVMIIQVGEDGKEQEVEGDVRNLMRNIIIHHQIIFRKVKILNSGLKFCLLYFNAFSCFQICLSIFSFMRGEATLKIKHGIVIFGTFFHCFFCCNLGQKLQDQGEKMRTDIFCGCNWVGTPKWLMRFLILMTLRNNDLPKIGFFDVFTLNRNNLRVIVQGAYSYLNLLKDFSN